jgi:hypothetical protein
MGTAMVDKARTRIGQPGLLRPRRPVSTPFELMRGARTISSAIGIVLGITVGSSPTLAEVEEAASPDEVQLDYNGLPHTRSFAFDLMGSTETQREGYDTLFNIGNNTLTNGLDDVLIPEAVWSLDASSGVHLDRVYGEFPLKMHSGTVDRQEASDLWKSAIPAMWTVEGASDGSQFIQFPLQVASCGGTIAERNDLEYCNYSYNLIKNVSTSSSTTKNIESNTTKDSNIILSNTKTTSIPPTQSDTSDALTTNSSIRSLMTGGNLIDLSNLSNEYCDKILASCANFAMQLPTVPIDPAVSPIYLATTPTDLTTTPIDPLTVEIDRPTLSPDIMSIGDSGSISGSSPIYVSPAATSAIPETSTWTMTIIGIGIVALVSVGRTSRRRNPCANSSGSLHLTTL